MIQVFFFAAAAIAFRLSHTPCPAFSLADARAFSRCAHAFTPLFQAIFARICFSTGYRSRRLRVTFSLILAGGLMAETPSWRTLSAPPPAEERRAPFRDHPTRSTRDFFSSAEARKNGGFFRPPIAGSHRCVAAAFIQRLFDTDIAGRALSRPCQLLIDAFAS